MARKKDPKRYCRQAVLGTGLFFLGFQMAGGPATNPFCPRLRHEMLFQHIDRARALPRLPAILCLGSSRTGCGLDDVQMSRQLQAATGDASLYVYNAAEPAADLITANLVLERLLSEGIAPRLVLVEVNP